MTSADNDLPRVPGHSVESVLGSGGMATVYRGRQLALDRPVAIKVLRAYGRDAEELNRRFEQEAKLIAALDHPNIVAIFEVTRTEAGDACYVMPLLAHGDLASRPRPQPESEVKRILAAVLEALGHAHGKGVVHRDVKPENVLFDARGTPLLADFGVALKTESRERLTTHGRTVGSSLTMSPEQARGEIVDGRSDLYSVGCVAFEMLTGRAPFDGDDFLVVALKHQQEAVPRLPASLQHWQPFIDCALAKRPEDRYPDAGAMLVALEAIGQLPAPASVRRWQPLAALAAVLLLSVLAVGWWWRSPALPLDAAQTPAASDAFAAVAAAISAQRWFDGAPASADVLLAPFFEHEPVEARALDLRDQLFDSAGKQLASADDAQLSAQLPRWRLLVDRSQASATPAVRELVKLLGARYLPALKQAHAARDRSLAAQVLPLAQALPQPDAEFARIIDELTRFPASGEPFRDSDGPELLLIPGGRLSGIAAPFAVTRTEISRGDYARFIAASGRASARCRDGARAYSWKEPGYPQSDADPVVCIAYADAVAYAAWLSKRSGRDYRLPTLTEWRALDAAARVSNCANLKGENAACGDSFRASAPGGRFPAAPGMPADLKGNVREWTQTCEYKEIGAVRRTFSNIGRFLTGKERNASGHICVGRYVAGSGWRDASADRTPTSEDEDQAAVDRGFRLLREIR